MFSAMKQLRWGDIFRVYEGFTLFVNGLYVFYVDWPHLCRNVFCIVEEQEITTEVWPVRPCDPTGQLTALLL